MSGGKKNWSALSSLARQWTLEDEEEQERERRRRQRNLSSSTDDEAPRLAQNGGRSAAERLRSVEEAEVPKPPPPAFKDDSEDIQAILRTRQERRQRRQVVEAAQTPIRERLEAEDGRDSLDPVQTRQQPIVPKKGVDVPPRRRLSQEQRGPWARQEESVVGREPADGQKGVSEASAVPEKMTALEKRQGSEKTSVSERMALSENVAASEKKPVLEKTGTSEKLPAPRKTSGSQRRLVSEKASIFEKSPVSETKLVPKRAARSEQPQAQEPPAAEGSQATTTELKTRALPEKSPLPSAEPVVPTSPTVASRLPPITLQVKIPIKEEEADTFSPTQVTYSSSLQRFSPRTISFRMSPRKNSSEATLTRSSSVRLPASMLKLGEKLERYHTAVQRSEAIKTPGSSRPEFFVAPVGVASKRHLFEKELTGQSRAEPASSRKENLRLSGVVTSRLNLWISRTQEPGDLDTQVPGACDVRPLVVNEGRQRGPESEANVPGMDSGSGGGVRGSREQEWVWGLPQEGGAWGPEPSTVCVNPCSPPRCPQPGGAERDCSCQEHPVGKEGRPVPGHQGVTSPACQDRPASFVSRALLLARPRPPAAASPLALLPFCLWTWGQECQGDSPSSFPAQPLGTRGQPGPSSGLSALGPQRPIQRLCLLTTFRASCPICSQQVCHRHCSLLLPT
nr:PREDICTED: ladinin-1 isoform X1 [Rhinolophus sinicus]